MQQHWPSEEKLKIEPRWFTSAEWMNGTAQRESKKDFLDAVARYYRERDAKRLPQVSPVRSKMTLLDLRAEMGKLRRKYHG
jgi:hypothetical protein